MLIVHCLSCVLAQLVGSMWCSRYVKGPTYLYRHDAPRTDPVGQCLWELGCWESVWLLPALPLLTSCCVIIPHSLLAIFHWLKLVPLCLSFIFTFMLAHECQACLTWETFVWTTLGVNFLIRPEERFCIFLIRVVNNLEFFERNETCLLSAIATTHIVTQEFQVCYILPCT